MHSISWNVLDYVMKLDKCFTMLTIHTSIPIQLTKSCQSLVEAALGRRRIQVISMNRLVISP